VPPVVLGRAPGPLIKPQVGCWDADLLGDERDRVVIQLRPAARKLARPGVERQDQGEAESRRPALPGDQLPLIVEQRPVLDQLVQVHPHHRAFINPRLTIREVLTKFRERTEAALPRPWHALPEAAACGADLQDPVSADCGSQDGTSQKGSPRLPRRCLLRRVHTRRAGGPDIRRISLPTLSARIIRRMDCRRCAYWPILGAQRLPLIHVFELGGVAGRASLSRRNHSPLIAGILACLPWIAMLGFSPAHAASWERQLAAAWARDKAGRRLIS
jgi:hypothetical protein